MSQFSSDDNFYDAPETLSIKTSQSSRPSPTSSVVTESRNFSETNVDQNTGNKQSTYIQTYMLCSIKKKGSCLLYMINKQTSVLFY